MLVTFQEWFLLVCSSPLYTCKNLIPVNQDFAASPESGIHSLPIIDECPRLSVVVPIYCEAPSIKPFLERIETVLFGLGSYELLFCLDPSPDATEAIVREEIQRNPKLGLLVFSRRFGQPAATMAGILHCRGEACVVIDVDLQDPPELIADLYAKLGEGYDVVYARRLTRKGETAVKRAVARFGYRLIHAMAQVEIPRDTGDFRIMNRRVIEELRRLPESDGFLRGMVAYVGFRQTQVDYHRDERASGAGKYNRFFGSLRIAFNGLIGFSMKPLSLLLWGGFGLALASGIAALAAVTSGLIQGREAFGPGTLALLIVFMGGLQLAGMGLLGEYIGRTHEQVRRRPRFIIDRTVNVEPRRDLGEAA